MVQSSRSWMVACCRSVSSARDVFKYFRLKALHLPAIDCGSGSSSIEIATKFL